MNEDYLDDRVIIPEEIENMTLEELQKAIQKLEEELKGRKSAT